MALTSRSVGLRFICRTNDAKWVWAVFEVTNKSPYTVQCFYSWSDGEWTGPYLLAGKSAVMIFQEDKPPAGAVNRRFIFDYTRVPSPLKTGLDSFLRSIHIPLRVIHWTRIVESPARPAPDEALQATAAPPIS